MIAPMLVSIFAYQPSGDPAGRSGAATLAAALVGAGGGDAAMVDAAATRPIAASAEITARRTIT